MSIRTLTFAPLLAMALAGCNDEQTIPYENDGRLHRFSTCGQLTNYTGDVMLETLLRSRYDYGWMVRSMEDMAEAGSDDGGGSPSDYTTTNVQEQGVDEIDIVKTDGNFLYVSADRTVQIVKSWPVEESERVAEIQLEGWPYGLFLDGDKLAVFQYIYDQEAGAIFPESWGGTRIAIYDITDRSNPTLSRTLDVEGWMADARMIDGDIYAVTNHWLNLPNEMWALMEDPTLPQVDWNLGGDELRADMDAKREQARAILEPKVNEIAANMELSAILPQWRDQVAGADPAPVVDMVGCNDVYRPSEVSSYNMLSLVNLDLRTDELHATGILSDGWEVYASQGNLYVAQASWWSWWGYGENEMKTRIHQFNLNGGGEPSYQASGEVQGWIYDQFAMSEFDGHLRVATSDMDWWWGWWGGEQVEEVIPANNLFVLKDDGNGNLVQTGALTGIAPNERIYASRMMGERGYIVTFRQVDPLFTLDLSDHTAPKVVGELKIPGYSAYLHPMGEDHLLAVGMAGTDDGTLTGLAVSVFDVSDMAAPTLAQSYEVPFGNDGWSYSEALWDHHAFTYHREVLSIPFYSYDWNDGEDWSYFSGILSLSATPDGLSEIGRVDHSDLVEESECVYELYYGYDAGACAYDSWWYASVRRSVYIEDNLFSISNYGIKVTDLNNPSDEKARVHFYPQD